MRAFEEVKRLEKGIFSIRCKSACS